MLLYYPSRIAVGVHSYVCGCEELRCPVCEVSTRSAKSFYYLGFLEFAC